MNHQKFEAEAARAEQWLADAERNAKKLAEQLAAYRRELRNQANAELTGSTGASVQPAEFVLSSAVTAIGNLTPALRLDMVSILSWKLGEARNAKQES